MKDTRIQIAYRSVSELIPYANNPRKNDPAVDAVAASIKEFGFKVPIILDENDEIIAGHTRLKAAKKLGYKEVPTILADDLSPDQVKAFRLADNKVGELAEWDDALLSVELDALADMGFDMDVFGFDADNEDEFDESGLDEDVNKTNVIVSINCNNVADYESIKERLQNLADEVNATVAVKMA